MTAAPSPARRPWRSYLLVAVVGIGSAAGVWYWWTATPGDLVHPDQSTPDPRLTFDTPFRNVRPDVKYVGDAACEQCHADIAKSYRAHPMGRSAEWVGRGPAANAHIVGANNPLAARGFDLRVERRDDGVWHTMSLPNTPPGGVPPYAVRADLAIGSGRRGRSYLTFDQGAAWQSPLSWFRQGERWDVSPGFDLGAASRRAIAPECLSCHTDIVTPVPGTLNRYREPVFQHQASVGCERCHGPGELHVAERTAGAEPNGPDTSIVNPRHLPADLKADVCRQCHLNGEVRVERRGRDVFEYRPGLPRDQFVSVFLKHPDLVDGQKSVGQFEQMERSRCYTGSNGKLSCTSCHDPHAAPAPADIARHYRDRCLTCHETRGCSAPAAEQRAKGDSCVACHMPAGDSANIIHAAVTDHRIMRRPAVERGPGLPPDRSPLVAYRAGPNAPPPEERDRDLALALGRTVERMPRSNPRRQEVIHLARTGIDAALARWPGDSAAWSSAAVLHLSQGEREQAVEAARRATDLAADSEVAWTRLATIAEASGDFGLMADAGRRLVAISPTSADHHVILATALASLGQWEPAAAEARAALAVHPLHANARMVLAVCYDRLGDRRAGRAELDLALRLATSPGMRAGMTEWYQQRTR